MSAAGYEGLVAFVRGSYAAVVLILALYAVSLTGGIALLTRGRLVKRKAAWRAGQRIKAAGRYALAVLALGVLAYAMVHMGMTLSWAWRHAG
jgi:hypothetical protein